MPQINEGRTEIVFEGTRRDAYGVTGSYDQTWSAAGETGPRDDRCIN